MLGKPIPTTKLAIQFTNTAIAIALGRGPCENSSAVISQGIEPGPSAKNTTKLSVDTTDKQLIQSIISCTYPKNSYQGLAYTLFPVTVRKRNNPNINEHHTPSLYVQGPPCREASCAVASEVPSSIKGECYLYSEKCHLLLSSVRVSQISHQYACARHPRLLAPNYRPHVCENVWCL